MKEVICTSSTAHLAYQLGLKICETKTFSDGELAVRGKFASKSLVLTSTPPPARNLLELFFLLDLIEGADLFFSYFGYSRQDVEIEGESRSGKVISEIIAQFKPSRTRVIHLHSRHLLEYLPLENLIPYDFFVKAAAKCDLLVAPDQGALFLVRELSNKTGLPYIAFEKKRGEQSIIKEGTLIEGRALIVDDMIATGETILSASQLLATRGLKIDVAATHGLFCEGSIEAIEKGPIEKVVVTNTLEVKKNSSKLVIESIAPFIKKQIATG